MGCFPCDDAVPLLAILQLPGDQPPLLVAVSNERQVGEDGQETFTGAIRLLDADGQPASAVALLPASATALAVTDLDGDALPELIVGDSAGGLSAFSTELALLWQQSLGAPLTHLLPLANGNAPADGKLIAISGDNQIFSVK